MGNHHRDIRDRWIWMPSVIAHFGAAMADYGPWEDTTAMSVFIPIIHFSEQPDKHDHIYHITRQ